jgi:hypothetical protein
MGDLAIESLKLLIFENTTSSSALIMIELLR